MTDREECVYFLDRAAQYFSVGRFEVALVYLGEAQLLTEALIKKLPIGIKKK